MPQRGALLGARGTHSPAASLLLHTFTSVSSLDRKCHTMQQSMLRASLLRSGPEEGDCRLNSWPGLARGRNPVDRGAWNAFPATENTENSESFVDQVFYIVEIKISLSLDCALESAGQSAVRSRQLCCCRVSFPVVHYPLPSTAQLPWRAQLLQLIASTFWTMSTLLSGRPTEVRKLEPLALFPTQRLMSVLVRPCIPWSNPAFW